MHSEVVFPIMIDGVAFVNKSDWPFCVVCSFETCVHKPLVPREGKHIDGCLQPKEAPYDSQGTKGIPKRREWLAQVGIVQRFYINIQA